MAMGDQLELRSHGGLRVGWKEREAERLPERQRIWPLGFPEPVSLAVFLWPSAGCSDQARLLGRVTNQPMYFHFLCLLRIFMQVKSVQGEIEGKRRKKGIMGLSKSNRDCSPSRGVTGLATEEDAPLACAMCRAVQQKDKLVMDRSPWQHNLPRAPGTRKLNFGCTLRIVFWAKFTLSKFMRLMITMQRPFYSLYSQWLTRFCPYALLHITFLN